jgi:FkbH-like protein
MRKELGRSRLGEAWRGEELKRLLERTRRHLVGNSQKPLPERFSATLILAARYVKEVGLGLAFLRNCSHLGEGVRVLGGRPLVENRGFISVGDRTCFLTGMGPVHLRAGPNGRLTIGNSSILNFGSLVSANIAVDIGEGVSIGQYCVICDTEAVDTTADAPGAGIEIGDGVWLAARVTVLPGTRIGKGSVITAGSIVSGDIPAAVVAGGIPARVLRPIKAGEGQAAISEWPKNRSVSAPPPKYEVGSASPSNTDEPVREVRPPAARGYLVSDFTIGELERILNDPRASTVLDFESAPFGQVVPTLLSPPPEGRDVLVVWTRPEAVIPAFDALLAYETVQEAEILKQVDEHCQLIARAASKYRAVFVPTWVLPHYRRTLGMLDARRGGATHALALMNLRLMEKLAELPNTFVLSTQRWTESVGRNSQQPKLWYMGKVPFHTEVFAEAATDIRAALTGLSGGARKLLVLDLDDTLWGGVVGDVGWESLRLGGHDSLGEAFVDFQRAIKQLKRRGIVLAIVSKNTESVALEAITNHPEMVLKQEDFVAWRINWQDKARNIAELVAELNLGLQSVVFIDDNPVERARVREALPDVLVPEWPEDKLLYACSLSQLRCFDAPTISREDAERTEMYAADKKREAARVDVGSLDDWLRTLDMRVHMRKLDRTDLARTTQLLNKTNQMNLTTRRVTEAELEAWAARPEHELWTLRVSDRFGDAGLTGVVSLAFSGDRAKVVDFVLSCRVMGRKVEETLAHVAVEASRRRGAARVEAEYLLTAKNKPCLEFWQRSGFLANGNQSFSWDARQPYPCPVAVGLVLEESA